jgi:NAD-dependent deacetylase
MQRGARKGQRETAMADDSVIQQAAAIIRASQRLVALTGSGISRESGVPTFRDALDGLWARFDPQELATPTAFRANPKLVWDWYEYRREVARRAQPNPGHQALAALQRRSASFALITQNVDDLHEQAGSTGVIRLHGSLHGNRCFYNCQGDPTLVDVSALDFDPENGPPHCPHCGRWVRPDVVWFGEMLPPDRLAAAMDAAAHADLMLVVGTSGLVAPAADLPHLARRSGARLIEVNPVTSALTPVVDLWLQGQAGEILPRLVAAL